jgi:hypothetical protein
MAFGPVLVNVSVGSLTFRYRLAVTRSGSTGRFIYSPEGTDHNYVFAACTTLFESQDFSVGYETFPELQFLPIDPEEHTYHVRVANSSPRAFTVDDIGLQMVAGYDGCMEILDGPVEIGYNADWMVARVRLPIITTNTSGPWWTCPDVVPPGDTLELFDHGTSCDPPGSEGAMRFTVPTLTGITISQTQSLLV